MTVSFVLKAMTLALVMTLCEGKGHDATLTPGAFGKDVVEKSINRIRSNCILHEDRLYMSRTAFVMTHDGEDTDTYRADFDGGIWKITKPMFLETQSCNLLSLQAACSNISALLGHEWSAARWSDLRKPLYSGLAAALYTLKILDNKPMPGDIQSQAKLWAKMYGEPNGETFRKKVEEAPIFECKDKLDLLFLLDSSGSVSISDYQLMKNFTASVVDVMDVSQKVRIADIIYSSQVNVSFDFDDYSTKSKVKENLLNAIKLDSGTNTAEGLNQARVLFNPSRGDRPDVKNVVVLVTDGWSQSFSETKIQAKRLKDEANVTVIAVGVGNYRLEELQAVASDPVCTHVLTLDDFDKIASIITEIQKSVCDANTVVYGGTTQGTIPDEGLTQTFTTRASGTTDTVVAKVSCGILHIYASLEDTKPGPAVFDQLYTAIPDAPAIVTLVDKLPKGTPVYLTVVGTRLPSSLADLRKCSDYTWSLGSESRKNVKVICEENGEKRSCTVDDINNAGLCPEKDDRNYPVENPCVKQYMDEDITRFPYIYSPFKFLQCDKQGKYYITLCPGGVTFNARTRECGFTNPSPPTNITVNPPTLPKPTSSDSQCTRESLLREQYYHTYVSDQKKFVQCDPWGKAYIMDCAPGTKWSQSHYTCIHANSAATRSVLPLNIRAAPSKPPCKHDELYAKPCKPYNFDICDHGVLKEKDCPEGLFYNHTIRACDWIDVYNPIEIPSSCP